MRSVPPCILARRSRRRRTCLRRWRDRVGSGLPGYTQLVVGGICKKALLHGRSFSQHPKEAVQASEDGLSSRETALASNRGYPRRAGDPALHRIQGASPATLEIDSQEWRLSGQGSGGSSQPRFVGLRDSSLVKVSATAIVMVPEAESTWERRPGSSRRETGIVELRVDQGPDGGKGRSLSPARRCPFRREPPK